MTHNISRFWLMNYGTSATLEAAAVASNISSDVSDDIAPVIGHLAKRSDSRKGRMTSRLTGGGGLPAAVLLPPALTVNMVSDVGRETGGDGMKTGTGFRQPIPRELEGEIAVMSRSNDARNWELKEID
jgi:hypothetical protein